MKVTWHSEPEPLMSHCVTDKFHLEASRKCLLWRGDLDSRFWLCIEFKAKDMRSYINDKLLKNLQQLYMMRGGFWGVYIIPGRQEWWRPRRGRESCGWWHWREPSTIGQEAQRPVRLHPPPSRSPLLRLPRSFWCSRCCHRQWRQNRWGWTRAAGGGAPVEEAQVCTSLQGSSLASRRGAWTRTTTTCKMRSGRRRAAWMTTSWASRFAAQALDLLPHDPAGPS